MSKLQPNVFEVLDAVQAVSEKIPPGLQAQALTVKASGERLAADVAKLLEICGSAGLDALLQYLESQAPPSVSEPEPAPGPTPSESPTEAAAPEPAAETEVAETPAVASEEPAAEPLEQVDTGLAEVVDTGIEFTTEPAPCVESCSAVADGHTEELAQAVQESNAEPEAQ